MNGMKEINYATLDYTRWSFHQRLFQKALALVVRVLARLHVEGFEKMPSTGAFVAATNHMHILDVPLYFSVAPRRTICFVSDNWQHKPFFGWFLTWMGQVVFVTLREKKEARNKSNRKALAQGLEVLRSGGILALAPEGGRGVRGLKKGLPGIAYMANRAPAPVQTVVIYGQEHAWTHWRRLRRVPVHIRFGPLIEPPVQKMKTPGLLTFSDQIMAALARLLPPGYRGVYDEEG